MSLTDNTMKFNKITIVGAGAIGGWLGVHLAQAGAQVSVLARGVAQGSAARPGRSLKSPV